MSPARTVWQLLDDAADRYPDVPAMVCGDDTITFAALRDESRRLATGLQRLGIAQGDHIGVWMHNSIEFVTVVYAVSYTGALLVPMNTWHRAREMRYVIAQSEISVLVVGATVANRSGADAVAELIPDLALPPSDVFPHLHSVVFAGGAPVGGHRLVDLMKTEPAAPAERSPTEPSYMLYTSGTTGDAKGVLLDDAGVTQDAELLGSRLGIVPGDRYYCPVPLFHAGGLVFALLAAHAKGATIVTRGQFEPAAVLDDIERHECAVIGGFEVLFSRLVEAAQTRGGAPVSLRAGWWVGTSGAFMRTEAELGLRLVNLYGMTEACGNVTSTPLEWSLEKRAETQGLPLDGRAVHIVDPLTDVDLPVGSVGEIRVSGWGLTHGYWRKPEATAVKFDGQGRLRSGDSGLIDDEGRLHFLGRAGDTLKVGGENIAPLEIEEVLAEHPAVNEVIVVGLPDEGYGQIPVAVVRLLPNSFADEDELRRFVKERLASFKVPRRVHIVKDFPRTSTGKVRKSEVVIALIGH